MIRPTSTTRPTCLVRPANSKSALEIALLRLDLRLIFCSELSYQSHHHNLVVRSDGRKPTEESSTYQVETYIRDKYEHRLFCADNPRNKKSSKKSSSKSKAADSDEEEVKPRKSSSKKKQDRYLHWNLIVESTKTRQSTFCV